MRLTAYTDYALRLLMLVAIRNGETVTIREVADRYGISRNHLMKIANQLSAAGIIEATRGRGGGMTLARDARDITIGEVVRLTEDGFALVECFDPESDTCAISPVCKLRRALREALGAFLGVLDSYSLGDLVKRPKQLERLLAGISA